MPLLQDGQDPDGLAALVAYHLHQLNISRAHIERAGITQDVARRLRQGSLPLNAADVSALAATLGQDSEDLLRPLTDDEKHEWTFYRMSARQVTEVWRRVAEASTAHNYSQRQLGELLDLSQSVINRVMRGERKSPVLNWHDAKRIAEALDLSEGAEAFILPVLTSEKAFDRG